MADVPQTLPLIILAQERRGGLIPQINRRAALLRLLKLVPGATQNVAMVAQGDGAIGENYAEGADAANFGSDAQVSAIWPWSLYRGLFHVSQKARDTAAASINPTELRNLIGNNIETASAKTADVLNKDLYVGDGTGTKMQGLDMAFKDDNTYATIDRTDSANAFWRSSVFNSAGPATPLSFAQIRSDRAAIYKLSGEYPDIAMVSPDMYNTVGSLFDATRRYTQDVVTARGPIRLDIGYEALFCEGTFFVQDKDAPENAIYYVNSTRTEIEYLPASNAIIEALRNMGVELPLDDGYGSIALGQVWEKLAKLGASDRYQGLVTLALKCSRPNSGGVRRNVQLSV